MQTLDAIKTRRTIRKFTEEPVSHEVIEKIVEASAYAPSWKNTQTARYIIIYYNRRNSSQRQDCQRSCYGI